MEGSEGDVDDAAGSDRLGLAIVEEEDCSLLHHDELGVLDGVGRVRFGPGRLGGLMHADDLAGGQSAAQDVPAFAAIGHFADRHLIEGERTGMRQCAGAGCCGCSRSLGLGSLGLGGDVPRCQGGGQSNPQNPSVDIFHAAIVRDLR